MEKKKLVIWIGSSKKDFLEFPSEVKNEMGHALYIAQKGDKHRDAKPLQGFGGSSVLEIVQSDGQGTYRTVYTVQLEEAVVVIHAFQKKSKNGIKTPKKDMDLIKQRLKSIFPIYNEWLAKLKKRFN